MKRSILLVFWTIAIVCIAFAQSMDLDSKIPMDEDVIYGKLDNGLTYYIKANQTPENRAELILLQHAGSVLEDEDQRGLAHFCEHMAFNGTKNFPKHELIEYLESTGMKFGADVNAYTSFDETVYGITIAMDSAEMLDKGLLVLYDWAHQVTFEDEEIDAERGVIHEEWRMGQGAMDRMQREMLTALFHNSKYSERLPIGLMSVVDSCEYDVLRRFYKDWYRPDLQAIVIVGDFDAKEMETKVIDLFGKIPAHENPRKRDIIDIPDHKETIVSVATDPEAPMGMIMMFYKHPLTPTVTVADYRADMLTQLLNNMISNRLQELTLLENPPYIQGSAGYSAFLGPKTIFMSMGVLQNNDVNSAMEALIIENQRMAQHGFTATELEREKTQVMKSVEKQYNERSKRKSKSIATELQSNFLPPISPVPGIEYEYELYKKYLSGITLEEVNTFAASLITKENVVISIMMPEKEGVNIPTEQEVLEAYNKYNAEKVEPYKDKVVVEPLIAEIPAKGKITDKEKNKDLDYQTWTFENGVKVVLMPTDYKEDEIRFEAVSWGGTSIYEQDDDVSASIAADVSIESGIGNFNRMELDKQLSGKNVSVTPYISELKEGLYGSCSVDDFETMLQLIYLSFTNPRVSETSYNSYINKQRGLLENANADPQKVWSDAIMTTMASNHPRRRVLTPEILDEADYKRVKKIVEHRFGDPGNFTFYFVGNIDPKKSKKLIQQYLGGLPIVGREESYRDLEITAPKGEIETVIRKGSDPKCMVVINFHDEMDYNYQERLNQKAISMILSTKLLEEIREKESGVYTIGAYPSNKKYPNEKFNNTLFFSCDPERSEELTKKVFIEINKLIENGPSEDDLKKLKEKMYREHETSVSENSYWMSLLKQIDMGDMTFEDYNNYNSTVEAMSIESMRVAAEKYYGTKNVARIMLKPEK